MMNDVFNNMKVKILISGSLNKRLKKTTKKFLVYFPKKIRK